MGNIADPEDQKALRERIGRLREDSPAQWGKMNAGQMVVHLADQMRCAKGDIKTRKVGNILHRTVFRWLVMAGMKAPKGKVKTVREFDQDRDGTRPTSFSADRQALLAIMDWFAKAPDSHPWQEHPAFGKMNKREWGRLAFTHIDHHLTQFGV